MKKKTITAKFNSILNPIVSKQKDKIMSLASIENIKEYIPDIDTEKSFDLVPIAFNACVANMVNKNDDVIDSKTAIAIYDSFVHKPINIEHDRKRVIGCILTAGFSEFKTDKPLTREEVEGMEEPFNITLGGVVWKAVNNNVTDLIEEASNPESDNYLSISASWELAFSEYNILKIVGEGKTIGDGKIITDESEIEELDEKLTANGGVGIIDENVRLYRVIVNDVLGIGIGLTETPAAEVKGILAKTGKKKKAEANNKQIVTDEETLNKTMENVLIKFLASCSEPNFDTTTATTSNKIIINSIENSSQNKKDDVKSNSVAMKIKKLSDITDENLKLVEASAVTEFIKDQIQEAGEKYVSEKEKIENEAKDLKEQHSKAQETIEENTKKISDLEKELSEMKASEVKRKEQEDFNFRMSALDNDYELDDDDRKVIASQIKGLDEEGFKKYEEGFSTLMKSKNKEAIAAAKNKEAKGSDDSSSQDDENAVSNALKNSTKEKTTIPNAQSQQQSTTEKFASAFSLENVVIK